MITLLPAVQQVCRRLAQPVPANVAGSTDKQVLQFMALLEEALDNIASRGQWQELQREYVHTTIADEDQGVLEDLANMDGFAYMIPHTLWDRTNQLSLCNPLDPQDWQALKAWTVNGPRYQFRLRGGHLLVNPAPTAGLSWAFEYMSANWGQNSSGLGLRAFGANDDKIRLPESIAKATLKWCWLRAKGLSYAQEYEDAERMVVDHLSRSRGQGKVLDMGLRDEDASPKIGVPPMSWPL